MMAILHIGPHKTGTTTIQYEIQRLTPELWLDGYEVPSTYNNASSNHYRLAHCLKQDIILHNRSAREYCDSTYLTSIVRIAARESSIILSAERFATPEIDYPQLELVLLPWKRHLRIVGYYRHYYSWFISWHNQIMKRKPDIATRSTIVQWIEDRKRVNGLYHTIYVMGSIRRYQDYFGASNVFVYNTHDPNYNLLYNFFCVAIPNANNSCSTVQMELQQQQSLPPITRMEKEENNSDDDYEKKNVSTILSDSMSTSLASTTTTTSGNSTAIRKKNSAVVLIYQDIAYAMKRKYHILLRRRQKNSTASSFVAGQKFPNDTTPKDYTIQQLSKMVQYHHEIVLNRVSPNNFNASYVQCPTPDSLEYLFNLTKQAYETFFPNSNNNAGEDEILSKLRHDFEMASKTVNELCSIDAVSLINNDPEWNQYFNSVFEIYT